MFKQFDDKINKIIGSLSIDEKIGQLNQICFSTDPVQKEKIKERIRNGEVGSLILADSATAGNDPTSSFNADVLDEFQRVAAEESASKIPLIFGRDVVYGHRTVYPIPLAQSCSFDPELIEECYSQIAKEASNDGIHWTFTPMLDLCRDPRWGRIIETPGEDPFVGATVAKAVVKGVQGNLENDKLVACAKHFIGYGASEAGRDYHHTEISDYSLYNYYLPAFRAAVNSGVGTVMSSFNDVNGEYVGSSKFYMNDILRDYLGFVGFVVSDWGAVNLPIRQGTAENHADCAEMSIKAGTDMDMVESSYFNHLKALINDGKVSEETLNNAVRRVLRIKFAKNLFKMPYSTTISYNREEHLLNSYKLACESMVLLKNNKNALPLNYNDKVILSGPFTNERRSLLGSWTLDGKAEETETIFEAFSAQVNSKKLLTSIDDDCDTVVLALGESNKMNGEAHSLADISLPAEQKELIKYAKSLGKKVIGVLCFGRPIALEETEEYFDAILYAWHSGSMTAKAVADIIFGKVSPSGRLSISFPKKTGHIPVYYNSFRPGKSVNAYYSDVWEGAKTACYIDGLAEPMYPFGYGLSYSTLKYGDIVADKFEIPLEQLKAGYKLNLKISIENTGNFSVKETVQLYIKDKVASVMRPNRELKGFSKLEISPKMTECATFSLGYDELGFYLKNGSYTVEKGEFEVYIGENSLTNRKITISVI